MAQLKDSTVNGNLYVTEDVQIGDISVTEEISKLDSRTTDYIVEQGESGVWMWRKWNSGRAELWGKHNINNLECNTTYGALYESASIQLPDFPFSFVETPLPQYIWNPNGGIAAFVERANPTTTSAGTTNLVRATAYTMNGAISMYFVGKWK